MRLTRAIPAGLVDSGLASLATFTISLYAINEWEVDNKALLGVYFLYMAAFLMASTVPTQMLYVPAEKLTLAAPRHARTALFWRIARLGTPIGVASAVLVGFAALVGGSSLPFADHMPFLITAAIATVFSPLQNHARRLLHLGGNSWAAASVSVVQVGGAVLGLVVLLQLSTAEAWVPIGALAIANVLSLTAAGLIILRLTRRLDADSQRAAADCRQGLNYRGIAPSGRWLVGTGMVSTGNNFLVGSAIVVLAGGPANALAGAAKTVAQPILVLSNGLRSVVGPRSMEAARDRDKPEARSMARTFFWLTGLAVVGYSAVAGYAWVGNPLSRLVDEAYTVPFLVVFTILANGLNGIAFPGRMELIGADREKQLFRAELIANTAQLIVALVVATLLGTTDAGGAFTYPIAFAVLGLTRIISYERAMLNHYSSPAEPPGAPTTISSVPDSQPSSQDKV